MSAEELLQNIRSLIERMGVKAIYGEPVVAGDRTIIPVARVRYGFGGGFGKGKKEPPGEGGGGGGGFFGAPAGYIEITHAGTRFVPIGERRKLAAALVAGFLIGFTAGIARRAMLRR